MLRPKIPLEILGLIGPILSLVEGPGRQRLPMRWAVDGRHGANEREQTWLIRELPTYSLDTVEEIVRLGRDETLGHADRLPLGPPPPPLTPPGDFCLESMLRRLAEHYFVWQGNRLAIQPHRMEEAHELALRMPVRHLIRYAQARMIYHGELAWPAALAMPQRLGDLPPSSQTLHGLVQRGLAEGHLHLWGVAGPEEAWVDHLLGMHDAQVDLQRLDRLSGAEWRLLRLGRAAVRLLALALIHIRGLGHLAGGTLPFYVFEHFDRLYTAPSPDIAYHTAEQLRLAIGSALTDAFAHLVEDLPNRRNIADLLAILAPTSHLLWTQYQHPTTRIGTRYPGIRRRLALMDRLYLGAHLSLIRLRWTLGSGGRGQRQRNLYAFLHQAFFRFLVCHTHYWQLGTQQGRTTGLQRFVQFYDAEQRRPLADDVEMQGLVIERLSASEPVHTVEGRISPPRNRHELTPWVLAYRRAARRGHLERFGLIVHFMKMPERQRRELQRQYAPLRSGRARRRIRRQAYQLFHLLGRRHPATPFIIGIDAANLELSTPPEVFAPAFHFLRREPIPLTHDRDPTHLQSPEITQVLERLIARRRLGMTYHVGEDFRHLLSGLRAIDEVISFLRPRPGDRLGHAIALALDPNVWGKQVGQQAVLSQQEWLDTLVWLHHCLGPGYDHFRALDIEGRIQQLAHAIYSHDDVDGGKSTNLAPPTLHDAWRLRRLDPYCLDIEALGRGECKLDARARQGPRHDRWLRIQNAVFQDVQRHIGTHDAHRLLGWYWYNPKVRAEGEKLIKVDMADRWACWATACRDAQAEMRGKIKRHQLVIEANPSANRIVGPMSQYGEHHIFGLTLDKQNRPTHDVRVTINTDDPGVFNTSLSHEYYLLGEQLLARGLPETAVEAWLEQLRANGEMFGFLQDLPPCDDDDMMLLFDDLKRRRPDIDSRLAGDTPQMRLEKYLVRQRKEARERAEADEVGALRREIEQLRRAVDGRPWKEARERAEAGEVGALRREIEQLRRAVDGRP